jgi:hypothetical protein
MPTNALDVVRRGLQAYADRGVFRGLDEVNTRSSKNDFRFVWLGSRRLDFSFDVQKSLLKFNNLLPNVPAKSILYADLKQLLKSRSDRRIPKHRRVDPRRAEVSCANRGGNVSIALTVKNNQYAYGLNKLVNLVHEIFVHLNDSDPDYMSENFDAPRE